MSGLNIPSETDQKVTEENVESSRSVVALGVLAANALKRGRFACFIINSQGTVELLSKAELYADLMPEGDAIRALGQHGYSDEQLVEYLRGRDSRKKDGI